MGTIDRNFAPGLIKKTKEDTKDIVIHVDSRDRLRFEDTTSNEYAVLMPEILTNVVSASLIHAEIPSSFYVFRAAYGNTSIDVSFTDPTGVTTRKTATIPDGNYNVALFPVAIAQGLTDAFDTPNLTFKCALSYTTMRSILSTTVPGGILQVHTDIASSLAEFRESLAFFMGFEFQVDAMGETIVSPSTVILNPFAYMMLSIREIDQTNRQGGLYGDRLSPNAMFAKVPLPTNSFDYTFYHPPTEQSVECYPIVPRLERLSVSWRFHNGMLVDFNHVEHSFSIKLTVKHPLPLESEETQELRRIRQSIEQVCVNGENKPLVIQTMTPTAPVEHVVTHPTTTFTPKVVIFLVIMVSLTIWFLLRRRNP